LREDEEPSLDAGLADEDRSLVGVDHLPLAVRKMRVA
jgi:hypothetical protein